MSNCEGTEEMALPRIVTSSLCLNGLINLTSLREGMSIGEGCESQSLSRVMCLGHLKEQLYSVAVVSVASLGKSIYHFLSPLSLRMIRTLDSFSLNRNVQPPNWIEVSFGKSIHQLAWYRSLSNTTREQQKKAHWPHKSDLNSGRSIRHSRSFHSLQPLDSNSMPLPQKLGVQQSPHDTSAHHHACTAWLTHCPQLAWLHSRSLAGSELFLPIASVLQNTHPF